MPKIFYWKGARFYFFSNEGELLEAMHIHVYRNVNRAKFWLAPEIELANNYGFSAKELREFQEIIAENRKRIEEKWNEYFKV